MFRKPASDCCLAGPDSASLGCSERGLRANQFFVVAATRATFSVNSADTGSYHGADAASADSRGAAARSAERSHPRSGARGDRPGVAHAFFPENLRKSRPVWKGKNIFSLEGLKAFEEDIEAVNDFFVGMRHGRR